MSCLLGAIQIRTWLTIADVGDQAPAAMLDRLATQPIALTAVGTSLTANYPWPDQVAQRLETATGRRVAVHKLAHPGATSRWGLESTVRWLADEPSPAGSQEIILVELLTNDADLRTGVSQAETESNHRRLIEALNNPSVLTGNPRVVVLLTMNPAHGLRGALRVRLRAYNKIYQHLATDYGVGLLDLYSRWQHGPPKAREFPDGLHPTSDQVAEVTVPAVTDYLKHLLTGN